MKWLELVDPRLQASLRAEWERRRLEPIDGLPRDVTLVLAGHRAAGKTTALPAVAAHLGREGVDLDARLAAQRPLKAWLESDPAGFRRAERETFQSLPRGLVVAVGGGFLSQHADLLAACVVVELPVSLETYVERLSADTTRGRLRPELLLRDELLETWRAREVLHARARPLSWVDLMLKLQRPQRARRVVTLPPGVDAVGAFAATARRAGAELLEVRSDLQPLSLDVKAAAQELPLLVARRTEAPLPAAWRELASVVDEEGPGGDLCSLHAPAPLSTDAALAQWAGLPPGARLKHVEPLTRPSDFPRLLETQRRLLERFGPQRVTVLCTGPFALPFRAVLAVNNALDYLALDDAWVAAPGQRLLADAVREARHARVDATTQRLGLFGGNVRTSRSPRLHRAPFDRISLPDDAPLEAMLEALHPHYAGFAVTSPFKKRLARDGFAAINTLVRREQGWSVDNTDVEGARAVLARLRFPCTVLGDGGVTEALRLVADGRAFQVLRRADVTATPLSGDVIWTWPPQVEPPPALRFEGARVVLVTYGARARHLARWVRERGGTPLHLGPRWLVAQARRQRALWETAS